jgi:cytosine/adenosine deaminase-related metal-dependent hydrolase
VLTTLQARFVFPVDGPPIEHGVVTFEGERIVAVGTGSVANRSEVQDLGAVALLPGLINAHTHLEFSSLPRPLGTAGISLSDWIRLVIAERGRRDGNPYGAISAGVRESLLCGVTTIGDITTNDLSANYGDNDVTVFVEVLGFSRARAASALAATLARLDEIEGGGPIRVGVSPHAPYTVSPELLTQLVDVARVRNLPVAMHLAESAEELTFLRSCRGAFQQLLEERSMWDPSVIRPGSRPLDYLRLLASAPRSLVIHGNYLDDEERAVIAAHRERMSLVYCPRTHAYFRHPPYPLAELLVQGVNVALGTDSRASNPNLDLLAEMRCIYRMHELDACDILRLGTLAGAIALGQEEDVGSLTPKKLANMIALPVSDIASDTTEALSELLSNEGAPTAVWVRGRKLWP